MEPLLPHFLQIYDRFASSQFVLQDSVVEPLLPHFLQFYEQDEQVSPPLKLEACARLQV